MQEQYYLAYEKRYQAAYSAGIERWGNSPEDEVLYNSLKKWVEENGLIGKKVIEYACGEGACGIILSKLGCVYHGVDISPSAVEKSNKLLEGYPTAKCEVLDMVAECVKENYDAALDCMGLHMLVTDNDRKSYLRNAYNSLKAGAPMLLFRESYRKEGVYCGSVNSIEEWGQIPMLPARAKDKSGYLKEMEEVGFTVEKFVEMDVINGVVSSANIYIRKSK